MLQNKFLIAFLALASFAFSQEKKGDTIYVYEEVIVHDTVYIEKPLLKIDKAIFTYKDDKKDQLELTQNGKKIQIAIDTLVLVTNKKQEEYRKSWFFGGKLQLGVASNSLFKEMNAPINMGLGIGIWTQKRLLGSNFSIGIGIDCFYWMSPFSFSAAQKDSKLNGYYFTDNNQPKLFKSIQSKHFQLQIPVQLYYKINQFTPSIGIFASASTYKAAFLGASGTTPPILNETQTFRAQALQLGFLVELQYELTKHLAIGINFSTAKANNLVFTNKNDKNQSFKTENTFTENRGLLQLVYRL